MQKFLRLFLALALVTGTALALAACGDSGDNGGGGGGKGGGVLKVASTGPDNSDPALYQTTQAVQEFQLAYTPLISYAHATGAAGSKLIPGLAESVPTPTNGGKTYTFKLRDGLKYSDGAPVKASDFLNTIKRLLKLGSVWSSFYSGIEGVDDWASKGDFNAGISGIKTNDKTGEITITLTQPDTKVLFALAEPYAAPMEASKAPPKTLKDPPPGVGPYVLTIPDFNHLVVLKRNPNWPHIDGIPDGNFDEIRVLVSDSVTKMTEDVINGKADFMTEDPTGDQLPEVKQKYPDRIKQQVGLPNTYYTFFDTTKPPFDKQEAREAVNYATDSRALVRIFGGRLKPTCNFIPEGMAGHQEFDCKYGDPNGPGNIEKAKQLVEQSGYKGMPVTYWTNNKDPRPAIADYFRDLLDQIGFKADIKTLDQQVYFGKLAENKTLHAQTGFTDWFQDYPHPGDFIDVLLGGDSLKSSSTNNFGLVDDPVLNKKLDELRGQDPQDVADEWAKLDPYVVNDKSYVAPYGVEESTSFFSERMDAQNCNGIHPVYKNDWLLFCLK